MGLSAYTLAEFIVLEDITRYIVKYRIRVVSKTHTHERGRERERGRMTIMLDNWMAKGKISRLKAWGKDGLEHFLFIIF